MSDRIMVSEPQYSLSFSPSGGVINSPFNMEALLRADPLLLKLWKSHPFTLDLDDRGRIVARYIHMGDAT